MLLIEDEDEVARAIMRGLGRSGLSAVRASGARAGLALKASFKPHVVLMDPILPDMDGRSLIALIRQSRDCGVLLLSGTFNEGDRVPGSGFGADDLMAKPTNMRELVARIHAVHRRVNLSGQRDGAPVRGHPEAVPTMTP